MSNARVSVVVVSVTTEDGRSVSTDIQFCDNGTMDITQDDHVVSFLDEDHWEVVREQVDGFFEGSTNDQ